MKYFSNMAAISELSESEGVFTTAQAARMDISRDALAHSCRVGRLERICHGAYRMSGTQRRDTDELNAFLEAHQSLPLRVEEKTPVGWHRRERYDGGESAANGRFLSVPLQDDRAHAHQYEKRIPFFCKA